MIILFQGYNASPEQPPQPSPSRLQPGVLQQGLGVEIHIRNLFYLLLPDSNQEQDLQQGLGVEIESRYPYQPSPTRLQSGAFKQGLGVEIDIRNLINLLLPDSNQELFNRV